MSRPRLTFDALLGLWSPSAVSLSPDGRQVAFVVSPGSHPKHERMPRQVWIGDLCGDRPSPIADDGVIRALPSWSNDGARLAFASDGGQGGLLAPWVREPSGELRKVAELTGSVEALLWAADDTSLLALAADPGSDGAGLQNWTRIEGPEGKPDPFVRRPNQAWRRLFLVDLASGESTEVSPEGLNVWEVGWTGTGAAVAVVSPGTGESAFYDADVAVLDLAARSGEVVYEASWQLQSPAISPDGRRVAFVEGWNSDRGPLTLGSTTVVDLDDGEAATIAPELDVQRLRWIADDCLFYVGQSGVETMCGRLGIDGSVSPIWQGEATLGATHAHSASIDGGGQAVAARLEAPGEPAEVVTLDLTAPAPRWRPLTSLNDELRGLAVPGTRRLTWRSDGIEIEGILLTPPEAPDRRLPVIVIAHGGPTNAWTMNFNAGYENLGLPLANRGYAVLLANPRGSSGRGQDFARSHLGEYGPIDLADILAGIRHLADAGVVDPERAAITGVSGGGYLSAFAATHSTAFRAAVAQSCISDWLSFHLTSNIGRHDEILLDGSPYDPAGNHLRLSPVLHAPHSSTPTLVLHGALDLCTPVGQAQELYQALTEAGVEAELVIYERAGHHLSQREYLLDMWDRASAWFDRHLGFAEGG